MDNKESEIIPVDFTEESIEYDSNQNETRCLTKSCRSLAIVTNPAIS